MLWCFHFQGSAADTLRIPKLTSAPKVDGNLSDWENQAHSDGWWTLERVTTQPWFNSKTNRLKSELTENSAINDLSGRYFMAWSDSALHFGAVVIDNQIDVNDPAHEPKRWYYKDAVAWFVEWPADTISERFEKGNHGFCFIADTTMPDYGAWWRHGEGNKSYVEEPLPKGDCEFAAALEIQSDGAFKYTIEATISAGLLGPIKPTYGALIRLAVVNCDPDGGAHGGHLIIYGQGDDDSTWTMVILDKSR